MIKLLNRGIMKRILITLILFEIILITYVNLFEYPKIKEANIEFAETSLNKLLAEKQKGLEFLLNQVEYETENLGIWAERVIDDEITEEDIKKFNYYYYVNDRSILTNKIINDKRNNVSNIYYSYKGPLSQMQIANIINTSKIDMQFKKSFERIPNAQWAYIITEDDMIRMYPAIYENVYKFRYNHDFNEDVYYYMANEINNPEKNPIWTNPYIDYLGKGLMITCSYPIYKNNKMFGVACIDISLGNIQKSISDLSIEGKGISYLIDDEGKIIYYPNYELKKQEQGAVVQDNIDLFVDSDVEKQVFKEMLAEKNGTKIYNDNGIEKFLIYADIKGLNWIIGIQVDRRAYFEDNILVKENFLYFMMFSIFLIIILLYYYYKSLSKPMFSLVDEIQQMGEKYIDDFKLDEKNDDEIKILDVTFKNLKIKLDEYIDMMYYKNNELLTIFNNMPGLLYIIDKEYNLKMFNKKSEILIYENRLTRNYKKCYELLFDRNDICEGCPANNINNLNKNGNFNEINNKDKIYMVSCYPLFNPDNTITELIVFSLDKTNEIIKNLELANAEKFALIGQLSASVTHQLKNDISVIKGAYYLLNEIESENEIDISEIREVLFELNQSIKDAENTVYNLLQFNNNGDDLSSVNIVSVIEQMLVIEKNNLYKSNIKVNKYYENDEMYFISRENPLKFIFSNLIRNAIDAMKSGGELTLKVFKHNEFIHISVIDTGEGIHENTLKHIFNPFFTTKENGSGIGLWIVKEQVQKLNGHIYCESKINKGAKFSIVLPLN